jgi:hypothetical protein
MGRGVERGERGERGARGEERGLRWVKKVTLD